MDQKPFKAPRKRCHPDGMQDMVFEVSTRLDAFLDALEHLLAELDTREGLTDDLEDLELADEDSKT